MRFEENLAEKLAAFRRRGLHRDIYDLSLFDEGALNEELVRELTYLKVYMEAQSPRSAAGALRLIPGSLQ